jgi:alpha(1,3/1,4) fucosyltransferase
MTAHQINFVDFHHSFSPSGNSMIQCLHPYFDLELSDRPDFLFYSVFGFTHAQPKYDHCIKIWCTEENFRPDFTKCDYALSFDESKNEPRHLRLPLYVRYLFHHQQHTGNGLVKSPTIDPTTILRSKTNFCNFICSNPNAKERIEFFHKLSKYKKIDSGGMVLNNLGYQITNKLEFISSYKFTLAFENSSYPGYVTEKLVEPMLVDSLPIYWGSPSVKTEFNTRSFVNCHDYRSLDDVVEKIVQLDKDDNAYLTMIKEPWFTNNTINAYCQPNYLVPFFSQIFNEKPHDYPKWKNIKPRDFHMTSY